MTIVEYVTEEVERQGHNTKEYDGLIRVSYMLEAWCYALVRADRTPTVDDAITLGKIVEKDRNAIGIRELQVCVGSRVCPRPEKVAGLLVALFESRDLFKPIEFYKEFEEVHPFLDGNGRTGKILLNWLNNSLYNPIFPPNNLWGREIRNP